MEIFRLSILLVVLVASGYAAPKIPSKIRSKIVRKLAGILKDLVKDLGKEVVKEVFKEVLKEELQGQAKRGVGCVNPAAPSNGAWFCENLDLPGATCHLECKAGFAPVSRTVTTRDAACDWSVDPATMECSPGVALVIGGLLDAKGVEVFGPMKDGKPACHYRIDLGLPDTRVGSNLDLVDGNLLACGGSMIKGPPIPPFPPARDNCIRMDMTDHTWQDFATMHTGRDVHSHVAMLGKLILIGGTDKPTSMDIIEPGKSKEFTEFPIPKTKYSCVAKISPTEYIITGGTYAAAKAFKVNVVTQAITPLANLTQERSGHGCAYVEVGDMKGVIIAGGLPQGNTKWTTSVTSKTSNVTEFYDLKTGEWTRMGDLHTARRGIRLLFVGGTLYSFGGFNGERYTEFVESFDFKTKKWIQVEPMLAARAFPSVAVVPEKFFECK